MFVWEKWNKVRFAIEMLQFALAKFARRWSSFWQEIKKFIMKLTEHSSNQRKALALVSVQ